MNVNVNKLKGKIVENGMTVSALAEKIGVDRATLYRKLSNNGETMLVKDANAIGFRAASDCRGRAGDFF